MNLLRWGIGPAQASLTKRAVAVMTRNQCILGPSRVRTYQSAVVNLVAASQGGEHPRVPHYHELGQHARAAIVRITGAAVPQPRFRPPRQCTAAAARFRASSDGARCTFLGPHSRP